MLHADAKRFLIVKNTNATEKERLLSGYSVAVLATVLMNPALKRSAFLFYTLIFKNETKLRRKLGAEFIRAYYLACDIITKEHKWK